MRPIVQKDQTQKDFQGRVCARIGNDLGEVFVPALGCDVVGDCAESKDLAAAHFSYLH